MNRNFFLLATILLSLSLGLNAQVEYPKWEFGGGLRLNYLGLSGGYEGLRYSDDYRFEMDYKEIGMDNYSPSLSVALGGRYKRFNLAFAGSKGSYDGSFTTNVDFIRDDVEIPAGSEVKGKIDMGIYALTTTYALIQKKHELGVGIGFLILNMGSTFSTTDINDNPISLGEPATFPMPFLAAAGRLNFGNFKISGSGGGALFKGEKDGLDYDVKYYVIELKGVYDFYKGDNWSYNVALGWRTLFMDMYMENDLGWAKETDNYSGSFISLRAKFSSTEKWTHIPRKQRKAAEQAN
jgi:hypothetical protein